MTPQHTKAHLSAIFIKAAIDADGSCNTSHILSEILKA